MSPSSSSLIRAAVVALVAAAGGGCGGSTLPTEPGAAAGAPGAAPAKGSCADPFAWYEVHPVRTFRCKELEPSELGIAIDVKSRLDRGLVRAKAEIGGKATRSLGLGGSDCLLHHEDGFARPGEDLHVVIFANGAPESTTVKLDLEHPFAFGVDAVEFGATSTEVICPKVPKPPPLPPVTGVAASVETPWFRVTATAFRRCDAQPAPAGLVFVGVELLVENRWDKPFRPPFQPRLRDDRGYSFEAYGARDPACSPKLSHGFVQPGEKVRGYYDVFGVKPDAKNLRLEVELKGDGSGDYWVVPIALGNVP